MLNSESRDGGFVTTAIITTVLFVGVVGGSLFFLLGNDEPRIDTVLKTDKADVLGGYESITQSEEEIILGGLAAGPDSEIAEALARYRGANGGELPDLSGYYTLLGISSDATSTEIAEALARYRGANGGELPDLSGYYTLLGISSDATSTEIAEALARYRGANGGELPDLSGYYTLLGISSDATSTEIAEALARYRGANGGELPDLSGYYTLLGISSDATSTEIAEALARYRGVSGVGPANFSPENPDVPAPDTTSAGSLPTGSSNIFTPDTDRDVQFPGFNVPTIDVPQITIPEFTTDDITTGETGNTGGDSDGDGTGNTGDGVNTGTGIRVGGSGPGTIEFSDGEKIDVGNILSNLALGVVAGYFGCLAGQIVGSLFPTLEVKTADTPNKAKECVLDAAATSAIKNIVAEMAAQYINWAVEGFPGRVPLFIENPSHFFSQIVDNQIARVIDDSGFGFLCDPLGQAVNISAILELQYRDIDVKPPRCSLNTIKNNIDDFVSNPVGIDIGADVTEGTPIRVGYDDRTSPDRLEGIEDTLDGILHDINTTLRTVSVPGRLARVNLEVQRARSHIGLEPTYRDIVTTPTNPSAIASHTVREECQEMLERGEVYTLNDCIEIYESAYNVNRRTQEHIDDQRDIIKTGDEFSDDLLTAIVDATMIGLVRKGLREGLGATVRGGGLNRLRVAAANTQLDNRDTSWVSARALGLVTSDPRGIPLVENTKYVEVLAAGVLVEDRIDLFNYARDSFNPSNAAPAGYGRLGSDNKYFKGGSGSLSEVNKTSIAPYSGGSFVTLVERVMKPRSVVFGVTVNRARGGRYCSSSSRSVTGFVYIGGPASCRKSANNESIDDFSLFRRSVTTALNQSLSDQIAITNLREIYETTVAAHTHLIGNAKEYTHTQGVARSVRRFRDAVKAEPENARKIEGGASVQSIIRDAVVSDIDTRNAPVFVRADKSHLIFLQGCEDTRNDATDDDTVYGNVTTLAVPYGNTTVEYIRTNCSLNQFFAVIDDKLLTIERETADLVHFMYAMAKESGFIHLPDRSAQQVLSTYDPSTQSVNQALAEKYQSFGEMLVGKNQTDGRLLRENWGALSPSQARQEYIESFDNKIEMEITQTFHTFSSNIPK